MRRWMLESKESDVRPSMRILTYTCGIAWRLLRVKQLSSALKHGFTTENAENIEQEFSWKLLRGLCDLCGESSSLRSVAREGILSPTGVLFVESIAGVLGVGQDAHQLRRP
jgi:hypothetical protein